MDSITKIKQRLSIVEVVGSYLDLKKAGKNYRAICPFHSEDTPSFMVSPEIGIYKCFGCGASGDIFSFVKEMEGTEFYEALKKLAAKAGVELEDSPRDSQSKEKAKIHKVNELAAKFYSHILLNHEMGARGLDYLLKVRGLKKDIIETFRLGYAPHSWETLYPFLQKKNYSSEVLLKADLIKKREGKEGFYDKFRGRVVFPLIDTTGKILGFMGRTVFDEDPKYLNTASTLVFNKSEFVYGLSQNRVDIKKQGAVLVEGPMDVISAFQYGIKNVVAPLGTSLTSEHLKIISRYTKEITLCFDSDNAGMEAIKKAAFLAEKQGLDTKVAMIPAPYKDLDELLREKASLASELFSSAVSVYDFFIVYALKKYDKTSGVGKKKIVDELKSLFLGVSSKVALDHYVKKIAQELEISEAIISSVFSNEVKSDEIQTIFGGNSQEVTENILENPVQNLDSYYLMLLLKAETLSMVTPFLENIDTSVFFDESIKKILESLKKFITGEKGDKLDIKAFIDTIDEHLATLVQDLYLWELDLSLQEERLPIELEEVLLRLEKRFAKFSIEKLRRQLELAEMEGNSELVREITAQIEEKKRILK